MLKRAGIIAIALLAALALALALFDWNLLQEPLERWASARTGRSIRIDDLRVRALSPAPSAVIGGLRVGQPGWAGKGDMASAERVTVAIELLPLLRGELVLPRLEIVRPRVELLREASGRANWRLGPEDQAPAKRREALKLPVVRNFVVQDGWLSVVDAQRDLRFEGSFVANQRRSATEPFRLTGSGELNGGPFLLDFTSRSLPGASPEEPYPFETEIRAGATRLTARGAIAQPLDRGALRAQLRVQGPDLADLHYLTNLTLPNTPPYELAGELRREGKRLHVRKLDGRVGDSDLAGDLELLLGGQRPRLVATLRSERLDLDDLGPAFGGAPATGAGEASSAAQRQVARSLAGDRRLLPEAKLRVARLQAMDATVRFQAGSVQAQRLPMRSVAFALTLEDAVLTLDPLEAELPGGRIRGSARLDARRDPPTSALDLRISGVRLENFLKRTQAPPAIEGTLQVRVRLEGQGDSVRAAASSADGGVTVVLPSGEVREAFAELTGVNVLRGLGLLLAGDAERAALRCGVAHFVVHDGVMTAERIVVDTEHVLITGAGNIDLESEITDFSLLGHPKEFRLVRLRAPITVRGPLRRPDIGIRGGEAAAQTGLAAALGALVAPLASVLALVDPGLAEDANCSALLRRAGRQQAAAGDSG